MEELTDCGISFLTYFCRFVESDSTCMHKFRSIDIVLYCRGDNRRYR